MANSTSAGFLASWAMRASIGSGVRGQGSGVRSQGSGRRWSDSWLHNAWLVGRAGFIDVAAAADLFDEPTAGWALGPVVANEVAEEAAVLGVLNEQRQLVAIEDRAA